MPDSSKPYETKKKASGNSGASQRWNVAIRSAEKESRLDPGTIEERLRNLKFQTLHTKNKVKSAAENLSKTERALRRRIESDFEMSMAEIGMCRVHGENAIHEMSSVTHAEQQTRNCIEVEEARTDFLLIRGPIVLQIDEYRQRVATELEYSAQASAIFLQERTKRGALNLMDAEVSERKMLDTASEESFYVLLNRFKAFCNSVRYFETSKRDLLVECERALRQIQLDEEKEDERLQNQMLDGAAIIKRFALSKGNIQRAEALARQGILGMMQKDTGIIENDFLSQKLRVLETMKHRQDSIYEFFNQCEVNRRSLEEEEAQVRSEIHQSKQTNAQRIIYFLQMCDESMREHVQIASREKETQLESFLQELCGYQHESLAECYRRQTLREACAQDLQQLVDLEGGNRECICTDEYRAFESTVTSIQHEAQTLTRIFEGFTQQRSSVFDEWKNIRNGIKAEFSDAHTTLVAHIREWTEFMNAFEEERSNVQTCEVYARDAILQHEQRGKGALFHSTALAGIEAYESNKRNDLDIHWHRVFTDLFSAFNSTKAHIVLGAIDADEQLTRLRIEDEFALEFKTFYLQRPQTQAPSAHQLDDVIERMESASAHSLIEGELQLPSEVVARLAGDQIECVSFALERAGRGEVEILSQSDAVLRELDALTQKKVRKRVIVCNLTDDVIQGENMLTRLHEKHQDDVEKAKLRRKLAEQDRIRMKEKLRVAEKEASDAQENHLRLKDRVREALAGQQSSPLAKRGRRGNLL